MGFLLLFARVCFHRGFSLESMVHLCPHLSVLYILCPRDRNEKLKFFSKSKNRGKLMRYLIQILKVHLELYFSLCPPDISEFYLSKVTKSEV